MADVTISQLTRGIPSGNSIVPYSSEGSTLGVPVSAILQNAGNIGIGTTTPFATLTISGTGAKVFKVNKGTEGEFGEGFESTFNVYQGSSNAVGGRRALTVHGNAFNTNNLVEFYSYTNNYVLGFCQDRFGRVGIGTNSPSVKLEVAGDVKVTGGNLFTPSRPAFTAGIMGYKFLRDYITGNTTAIGNFNKIITNVGNNFNSTTGRFTAPVAGVYWFNVAMGYIRSDDTAGFGDLTLFKNDVDIYSGLGNMGPLVFRPANGIWVNGSVSTAIQMNTGENVSVGVTAYTNNNGQFYLSFGGYLIG